MLPGKRKPLQAILIIACVLCASLLLLDTIVHREARRRLERYVHDQGLRLAPGYDLTLNLFRGRACIASARLLPIVSSKRHPLELHGRVDTVLVNGFSLLGYLRTGELHAHELNLVADSLEGRFFTPAHQAARKREDPPLIAIDDVRVRLRRTNWSRSDSDTTEVSLNELALRVKNWRFGADNSLTSTMEESHLELDDLQLRHGDAMRLRVADTRYDQTAGVFELRSVFAGPVADSVRALASREPLEKDVISAQVDTIRICGLDLNGLLEQSALRCDSVVVRGGTVHVARDKTLPDPAWRHRPLPSVFLRTLNGTRWGSLITHRLDVTYWERSRPDADYARIPFTGIQASIIDHGALAAAPAYVTLDASAIAFEGTPVRLRVVIDHRATDEAMHVSAHVGALPLSDLQQATGNLMGVEAQRGAMDTMVLHMRVNDRAGRGHIWVAYSDVKLRARSRKEKSPLSDIASTVLNAIIVSNRNEGRDKLGWVSFDYERRRDRGFFNALWLGMRSGLTEAMLPRFLQLAAS